MKKMLLILLVMAAAATPAFALDLGDTAPEIAVEKWMTGDEADPTKTDGNTIYLVEVWSTTCPPCVRSIPLLNELQAKYADQGLKIISFTPDSVEEVEPFLDQHPMEYSSFIDKEGASYINYMAADNRNTIPHAFLFDRSGALVWIGNPLDNLERRIEQVLDGSLNLEAAIAVRDLREDLQNAFEQQDIDGMLSTLTSLEELEPENGQYYQIHYRILTELAMGEDSEVRKLLDAWYRGCYDRPEDLMILAMVAMEQGHPGRRNPELGLAAARRAYELPSAIKNEAGLNLAEMYKGIGRLDLSLGIVKELIESASPEYVEAISAVENFYERLLELGKNPDKEYQP